MRVGFTGSQYGMTSAQLQTVEAWLKELKPKEFHHGDCIGSDAQAHAIALKLHVPIVLHPPIIVRKRAYCNGAASIKAPQPYLVRNLDIVQSCDLLIAAPKEESEGLRSGTWTTVRYARRASLNHRIILPLGRVIEAVYKR